MLQSSKLPLFLWGESVLTAVYLRNRVTNKRTKESTPYELFYGKRPTYAHLIEFGQELQVLDKSRTISKFEAKTIEAFLVSYGDRINTYRCYNPKTKDVLITTDVFLAPHV